MSGIGSVNNGAATADLMKILESSQQATIDLATKMMKVSNGAKSS